MLKRRLTLEKEWACVYMNSNADVDAREIQHCHHEIRFHQRVKSGSMFDVAFVSDVWISRRGDLICF